MSGLLATAKPRRIKAAHRRRRKCAVGLFVQRYYDPQVGRFLSVDPIAAGSGLNFNRYSYAANNPYRFTDPDGRDCKSKNGTTTCSISVTGTRIPQKIAVMMPTSISFKTPAGVSGTQKSGSPLSHKYGYPASHKKGDGSVQRSIVNDPTPAPNDKAATPQGTPNNASPDGWRGAAAKVAGALSPYNGDSPVRSYSATDNNGNTWAINVTEPGHGLHFGFVLRGSVGGVAVTFGEGWAPAQAAGALSDMAINDVWIEQNKRNIDAAR